MTDDLEILFNNSNSFCSSNNSLPREVDLLNAMVWLNYVNSMHYAYSSPWIMLYVERPGICSRLSSRTGAVNDELYNVRMCVNADSVHLSI